MDKEKELEIAKAIYDPYYEKVLALEIELMTIIGRILPEGDLTIEDIMKYHVWAMSSSRHPNSKQDYKRVQDFLRENYPDGKTCLHFRGYCCYCINYFYIFSYYCRNDLLVL